MPTRHVALLTTSYPAHARDGAGHFVRTEARELAASGYRVTVVCPAPGVEDAGIELVALPGGDAFGWPGVAARLRERPRRAFAASTWCARAALALRRLEPDELVAHFLLPSLFPLAEAVRCPITAVAHGSDVALFLRWPFAVRHALGRRIAARRVQLRFVSERLREQFLRAVGAAGAQLEARSSVAPCAIDVSGVPERVQARRALGVDGFLALGLSRLVPGKRIDWALVHAPVPTGARWVVLGDGPDLRRLRGTFPHVEFLGRVDRPTALTWLRAADVLVACSEREGAPTAIREARLLGTPVWTNDVGDVREWALRDSGILVLSELEPRDVTANNGTGQLGHGRAS